MRSAFVRHTALALALALVLVGCGESRLGTLQLTVRDAATGGTTAARIEVRSDDGASFVAPDALRVFADCGSLPVHNWVPWLAGPQAEWARRAAVENPFTGTRQFYSDGTNELALPSGRYTVIATKGTEYEVTTAQVVLAEGQTVRRELELTRWIDLPAEGWWSADDHLHIPRPASRFDPPIATWMQAEDIHVANLLQMGLARDVHLTPQVEFGAAGIFRAGDTLVVSGQENPRTHVLGHSIILGARQWLDDPAGYPLYGRLWARAHEQGAVNGYAHWAVAGAEEGLAVWGHRALLDFVEVLNLGAAHYERWYEALNLGIRLTPTAGTDYPCLPGLPGRERFYARVDGPLEYEAWLSSVRAGRTFVTNGPAIELRVGHAGPGEELDVPKGEQLAIRGRVRFDPGRDDVRTLELIQAGDVVLTVHGGPRAASIELETRLTFDSSTWVALRAAGLKRGETEVDLAAVLGGALVLPRLSNEALLATLPPGPAPRTTAAHTGAVHVTVEGSPPISEQPRARQTAAVWLARLAELEARIAGVDAVREWARFPGRGDGVDEEAVLANREALLAAIEAARRHHGGPARSVRR